MSFEDDYESTWFLSCRKGLRMIQDSELGYAVLYASTDRFCNPAVDLGMYVCMPPLNLLLLSLSEHLS